MAPFGIDRACANCKTGCKEQRKCAHYGLCLFSFFTVLAVVVAVRHAWRMRLLNPVLDLIVSSNVCQSASNGVCELDISEASATKFDLHERESPILGFLFSQVIGKDRTLMEEVLRGAHIRVQDTDGWVYKFLTSQPGAYKRISSHRSTKPQFGIPEGHILSTILVGAVDNTTWLQMESSHWDPFHRPLGALGHILDYVEYFVIRQNVGPLGTSPATDRHPLTVGSLGALSSCPRQCPTEATKTAFLDVPLVAPSVTGQRLRGLKLKTAPVKQRTGDGVNLAGDGLRVGFRLARRLTPD